MNEPEGCLNVPSPTKVLCSLWKSHRLEHQEEQSFSKDPLLQMFHVRVAWVEVVSFMSVQFSSVTQSCPTLSNPMDTPVFSVHHQLLELVQTHVHWVSNAIQPSHPLLPSSPPALNLFPFAFIFPSISVFSSESTLHISGQSIGASASASVLPMNIQG